LYEVTACHEKPDLQKAGKYAADGCFFWDSGMFAFSAVFMAGQFRSLAPDVFNCFEKLKVPAASTYKKLQGIRVLNSWQGLDTACRKTKSISFDYAIAEKCTASSMIRACHKKRADAESTRHC